ncbi:MAG: hypothetical protein K8I03_03690 [Ignavibacteria bacterium]|nr:hypothetical protein [Ignavibacteria bacterium]
MMKIIGLISIAAVLILSSCSGSDSDSSLALKKGRYQYILTDSSGTSLVEGLMTFDSITKQTTGSGDYLVSGSYTISKLTKDTIYQGFTTMEGGELKGYYNDKQNFININTNPRIADANVFLNANIVSGELKGGWYYSTFRSGHTEGGLFNAKIDKK